MILTLILSVILIFGLDWLCMILSGGTIHGLINGYELPACRSLPLLNFAKQKNPWTLRTRLFFTSVSFLFLLAESFSTLILFTELLLDQTLQQFLAPFFT